MGNALHGRAPGNLQPLSVVIEFRFCMRSPHETHSHSHSSIMGKSSHATAHGSPSCMMRSCRSLVLNVGTASWPSGPKLAYLIFAFYDVTR